MEKYSKLGCSDFSDFENKKCDNGVLTLQLSSWNQFHNVVNKFENNTDYIWRGQRCYCKGWKLKSSFDRKFPVVNNRKVRLQEILKEFRQRLQDIQNSIINSFSEDEIWAIGQHYGLPTPLLDWTQCPYIAAYFVFFKEDKKCQSEYRVVYALNRAIKRPVLKRKTSKSKKVLSKQRFVEFLDLDTTHDKTQNKRLKNQKGKFTKALNGDDIKANIERLIKKKSCYQKTILLAEILIPDRVRDECLGFLDFDKEITHGKLFPDYAGAVEICKMELGIDM